MTNAALAAERLSRKEFTRTQVRLMLSSALIFRDAQPDKSHEDIIDAVLDLNDFVQQRVAEAHKTGPC